MNSAASDIPKSIFGINLTPTSTSTLTLEKLLKAHQMLREADEQERRQVAQTGYWEYYVRFPTSKKRRIRKKWRTTGQSCGLRWIPPIKPDPAP